MKKHKEIDIEMVDRYNETFKTFYDRLDKDFRSNLYKARFKDLLFNNLIDPLKTKMKEL